MDYIKLIDLYLEGELNQVEKDLLFAELSRNPELREYFEQQMQFNHLFQMDMQTISPPLDATNYIFSTLNFRIPNSAFPRPIPAPLGVLSNMKQILTKYVPFVASSVIGGLVSFVLLWFFIPSERAVDAIQQETQIVSQPGIPLGSAVEVPKIVASEVKPNSVPMANLDKAFQSALQNWLQQFNLQSNSSTTFTNNGTDTTQVLKIVENSTPSYSLSNQPLFASFKTLNKDEIFIPSTVSTRDFGVSFQDINPILHQLSKFSLSFRGYLHKSQPEVNVNLTQTSLLNNTGIGIGYEVGKNATLGFEFGQEKFAQKFTLIRNDDKSFYKQNPLLWWYGLYYQQAIGNLFRYESLKPTARIFFGGTPVGPLVRGMVGLQYNPDRRVSLFLGWEGTLLWYKVQNNLYQTRKNGLTYGVSVKY